MAGARMPGSGETLASPVHAQPPMVSSGTVFIGASESPDLQHDLCDQIGQIDQDTQLASLNCYPTNQVSPFDVAWNEQGSSSYQWFARGEEFLERLASPQNAGIPVIQKTSAGMLLLIRTPKFLQNLLSWTRRIAPTHRMPMFSSTDLLQKEESIIAGFRRDLSELMGENQINKLKDFAPWLGEFNKWRPSVQDYLRSPSWTKQNTVLTGLEELRRNLGLLAYTGKISRDAARKIESVLLHYSLDVIGVWRKDVPNRVEGAILK